MCVCVFECVSMVFIEFSTSLKDSFRTIQLKWDSETLVAAKNKRWSLFASFAAVQLSFTSRTAQLNQPDWFSRSKILWSVFNFWIQSFSLKLFQILSTGQCPALSLRFTCRLPLDTIRHSNRLTCSACPATCASIRWWPTICWRNRLCEMWYEHLKKIWPLPSFSPKSKPN